MYLCSSRGKVEAPRMQDRDKGVVGRNQRFQDQSSFLPDDLLPRGNDFFYQKANRIKLRYYCPDLGTAGGWVESRRIRRDPSPPLRGYDEVCCCCCNCCSENGAGRWGRELDLNGHLDGRWRGCGGSGGCDGVRPGGPTLTTATPDRESTCGGWWTRHHLKFRCSVFKHGAALVHCVQSLLQAYIYVVLKSHFSGFRCWEKKRTEMRTKLWDTSFILIVVKCSVCIL